MPVTSMKHLLCRLLSVLQVGGLLAAQTVQVNLLDNAFEPGLSFAGEAPAMAAAPGFWRPVKGDETPGRGRVVELDGRTWIETDPGPGIEQPVAAYEPTLGGLIVRGEVRGAGRIEWVGAGGASAGLDVGSQDGTPQRFEWSAEDIPSEVLRPRLTLRLSSRAEEPAHWTALEALVPLPGPSEGELREALIRDLDEIFGLYDKHGVDRAGSKETRFITNVFDALSGEALVSISGSISQVNESLLLACSVHDDAEWSRQLEGYLTDLFALGFHAETGLPCDWDPHEDRQLEDKPVEIARLVKFLLDVHEYGPPAFRARAREQAVKIAETVLDQRLPDGRIAVKYVPKDGSPRLDVPSIRQLNVAALLARIGAITGKDEFLEAALGAIAEIEYTLFWGGTWDAIDPDFDDSFGNYGAGALEMAAAYPDQPVFRRFLLRGAEHFHPLWRRSLAFGGSTAADQIRCWKIYGRYADLEGAKIPAAAIDETLRAAVRVHFKGQQYDNGAWGDITVVGHDPEAGLNVGDFSGAPQNLVEGLAWAYGRLKRDNMPTRELRAMYAAVLDSSRTMYRRKFGWLATRSEQTSGANYAIGEQRMLPGMVDMLVHLSPK